MSSLLNGNGFETSHGMTSMKLSTKSAFSILAAWTMAGVAQAAGPPGGHWHVGSLDRPTPPPCCADGVCYATPTTFGWYPTRWRRWPGVFEPVPTPDPADLPPDRFGPEITPYETPPPEEEDRRAPPPTRPRPELERIDEELDAEAPRVPAMPPNGPAMPAQPLNGVPFDNAMPPPMPWDLPPEPTTDADPPPAPPVAGQRRSQRVEMLGVATPATRQAPVTHSTMTRTNEPANDPPPPLPLALDGRRF